HIMGFSYEAPVSLLAGRCLEERDVLLEAIFESTFNDCYLLMDKEARVWFYNRNCQEMSRQLYDRPMTKGIDFMSFVDEDRRQSFREMLDLCSKGQIINKEIFLTVTHQRKWLKVTMHP